MCLEDLEPLGRSFLPRALWEFVSVGVEGNISRDGNRQAFDETWLYPRVLNEVSERTIERTLFGKTYDAPFGIAPMGASAMFGFEADLNFARAAWAAKILYVMSGSALIPMEKILEANPDVWFQAYIDSDRAVIEGLTERAWAAGVRNLVITVDVPVPGKQPAFGVQLSDQAKWAIIARYGEPPPLAVRHLVAHPYIQWNASSGKYRPETGPSHDLGERPQTITSPCGIELGRLQLAKTTMAGETPD